MANRTTRRHNLTEVDRQKGHECRARADYRRAARKGWETRRRNGGFAFTSEEHAVGGATSGRKQAKARDHAYWVRLGQLSGEARGRKRS